MSPHKAQLLWNLAIVVDILHVGVILLLLFGTFIIGPFWSAIFGGVVLGLQLAFMHCPMVVLANWLRGFKEPRFWRKDGMSRGFVYMLYKKWGIAAIIPISAGIFFPIWYIPMVT